MIPSLTLTLTLAILGQCSGGSCPAPSMNYAPSMSYAPMAYVAYQAPAPTIARHRVEHDGMAMIVEGWQAQPGGLVNWKPDRPWNATALREAQEKRAAKVAADATAKVIAKATADATAQAEAIRPPQPVNYGLDVSRTFGPKGEGGGYHATTAEGLAFINQAKAGSDKVPDDSGRPFVTVIGTPSAATPVTAALGDLRADVRLNQFGPEAWQVKGIGLSHQGDPQIVVQDASGKVVYRESGYDGDAKSLFERIKGKLRKPNPNYDPAKDPGPLTAASIPDLVAFAVIGGCVLLLLVPKGKAK